MRRKVVFIVTSFWAHGELQIALDFAKRFDEYIEPIFLLPKLHTRTICETNYRFFNLVINSPRVNRLLLADIESTLKPDMVILADFMNYAFCYRHYGITERDLDVFSGLICAFDIYNYGRSIKVVDAYGYVAKHMSDLSLDKFHYLFQPVPICSPTVSSDKRVFRYGLVSNPKLAPERSYRKSGKCNILIVCSEWQFSSGHPGCVHTLHSYLIDRLCRFVVASSGDYTFTCVGHDVSGGRELGSAYRYCSSLSATAFDRLLDDTDCAIGFNFISTSLAKIALKGIPVVNIKNSFAREGKSVFDVGSRAEVDPHGFPQEHFYPFKLFPVGWYRFLSHLEGNQYFDLIHDIEMYGLDSIREVVSDAIRNTGSYRQRTNAYLQQVARLDDHYDIRAVI